MPDENSAATEHSIMQEITAPLATLPDNPVPTVADVEFPIVLRGYDRLAVDAYVKQTSQLVAELHATRSPEAAVRRALERVGEEVSAILQRAHDAASQITAHSRSEAEDRLEVSRREAAEITVAARDRLKELDAETDRIWAERQRIVEDAQDLARQLLSLAESAAARFPPAEEPGAAQQGEAVAGVPGGAGLVDGPHQATFADEPGGRAAESAPGEPEESGDRPAVGQGDEPGGPDVDQPHSHGGGEAPTEAFDGDATMIMPPIQRDEDPGA